MSDPRENCPWKCKHCLCYDGKIRELTESCELAMTERNKQADMAQELLAKNTRLTKENERLHRLRDVAGDYLYSQSAQNLAALNKAYMQSGEDK